MVGVWNFMKILKKIVQGKFKNLLVSHSRQNIFQENVRSYHYDSRHGALRLCTHNTLPEKRSNNFIPTKAKIV